jgi:formamidopyrimidine-DNA glycosylase
MTMPALVEIEVIRRDLEREIVTRRIKDVEVRPGTAAMKVIKRYQRRKELADLLEGAKVESVTRIGRNLLLDLDNGNVMVIDLSESGLLLKTSGSEPVATNTHIVLGFTIGGQLRLVDPDKTSEVYVVPRDDASADGMRNFAIDPLEDQVTWHHFSGLLEQRALPMKKLLLDESFIVGLGDVYSDEILFGAGIRHDRQSDKLTSQDVRRIYRALMEILQDAVKARGTGWGANEFSDLTGTPGQYQLELKVYERDGEPCRRCRQMVIREEVDGYVTYFCPQCQT